MAKKRPHSSPSRHLKKYTPEERKAREDEHHAPVPREHFEGVMRRLITTPPPKERGS